MLCESEIIIAYKDWNEEDEQESAWDLNFESQDEFSCPE